MPAAEALHLEDERAVGRTAAEQLSELRFRTPDGTPVKAFLRRPLAVVEGSVDAGAVAAVSVGTQAVAAGSVETGVYGIVLVAGRETGREAAAIVPPPLKGFVLAVEYPGEIPEELDVRALVGRLGEIRETARRMPGILRGAGHYLAALPEVDPLRTALVGVSFGVPFAAPAARDPVFRGVALFYGGADLALLFRTHLPTESRLARRVVARGLAWLFRDLEPSHHVGHISPRPLLLINGVHDDWVPRESALRLREAAGGPVHHIWMEHGHLMPWHLEVMREMADSTLSHFEFLPGP
jgi:dienelactone hydrolase